MAIVLEKRERRLGERLFIKGDRCLGPKCAQVRKGYAPGMHGKKRGRRREPSEFSTLLTEKQRVRFFYSLDNGDLRRYSIKAAARGGVFNSNFIRLIELRLDNVVYRLGLAPSRRAARQLTGHGHITVNAQSVDVPSYEVRKGDVIGIKEGSVGLGIATGLDERLKKHQAPKWLLLDPQKKTGTVVSLPDMDDAGIIVDPTKIKEFYSR